VNNVFRTECEHVRAGEPVGETLTATTVLDHIFAKAPDTVQLCLMCAGRVTGLLWKCGAVGHDPLTAVEVTG